MSVEEEHPVFQHKILEGFHLLQAAAGTGKTWTISSLVARAIIEYPLLINQILVVTFTNASTAELEQRIYQRLHQLSQILQNVISGQLVTEEDLFCQKYLSSIEDSKKNVALNAVRNALAHIDEIATCTIHSMCQRIIQKHGLSRPFSTSNYNPGMSDDTQDTAIERAKYWWKKEVISGSASVLACLSAAHISPAQLSGYIRAYEKHPHAHLCPATEMDWKEIVEKFAQLRIGLLQSIKEQGQDLLDWIALQKMDRRKWNKKHLLTALNNLEKFCISPFPKKIPEAIQRFSSSQFKSASTQLVPPTKIPYWCDNWEKFIPTLYGLSWKICSTILEDNQKISNTDRIMHDGYDALLHVVNEELSNPVSGPLLAEKLRQEFPLAFIDECQDIDSTQWNIFKNIYLVNESTLHQKTQGLILVGDPKQSIYGFRGADIYTYLNASATGPVLHRLQENHRSHPSLVTAVNALFSQENSFLIPEIQFFSAKSSKKIQDSGEKDFTAEETSFFVKEGVHVILSTAQKEPQGKGEPQDETSPTAAKTSQPDSHLPEYLDFSSNEKSKNLDLLIQKTLEDLACLVTDLLQSCSETQGKIQQASDIAILVHTHQQGCLAKAALLKAGISAKERSRSSVRNTIENEELTRIVAAIDQPTHTGLFQSARATILLSGWKPKSEWQALERFREAKNDWYQLGATGALRRFFRDCRTNEHLVMHRNGEQSLSNLMHILELIEPTATTAQVLNWLMQPPLGEDPSDQLRSGIHIGQVQIITTHSSKGLEFPCTIIPFLWMKEHKKLTSPMIYHCRKEKYWKTILDLDPNPKNPGREKAVQEQYAESVRLLYVALTRAKHFCFLLYPLEASLENPLGNLLLQGSPPDNRSLIKIDELVEHWAKKSAMLNNGMSAIQKKIGYKQQKTPVLESIEFKNILNLQTFQMQNTLPKRWHSSSFSAWIANPTDLYSEFIDSKEIETTKQEEGFLSDPISTPSDLEEYSNATVSSTFLCPTNSETKLSPITIRFPTGSTSGQCLHALLENIDLTKPIELIDVQNTLKRFGLENCAGPSTSQEVALWLESLATQSLPISRTGHCALRLLKTDNFQKELSFQLATGSDVLHSEVINSMISKELLLSPAHIKNLSWSGFLEGVIDLVFEHEGRYYIIDWKSHFLGTSQSNYSPEKLKKILAQKGYALQLTLYTLAMHRYLKKSLPYYNYEQNMGEALCVFLRGISILFEKTGSKETPHRHHQNGFYSIRPSHKFIEKLDSYIGQ